MSDEERRRKQIGGIIGSLRAKDSNHFFSSNESQPILAWLMKL
jgi:hypothetical protein